MVFLDPSTSNSQDKRIGQDQWKFAMHNRDKRVAEYRKLMNDAAAAASSGEK